MENSWISELKSKDIPVDFRDLSTTIGMESTLKVLEYFQGATVYFPKINGGNFGKPRFRAMRKRLHELKADGVNYFRYDGGGRYGYSVGGGGDFEDD